jgi:hypothetical protein
MPVERSDNTGTAKLFEEHLPEQMRRVLQLPKIRKTFGVPAHDKTKGGENRLERENWQIHWYNFFSRNRFQDPILKWRQDAGSVSL